MQMGKRMFPAVAVLLLVLVAIATRADSVIRCKDSRGHWQFTDDERKCAGRQQVEQLEVELQNWHSEFGAVQSYDYHSYPFRAHQALAGYSIRINVEESLLKADPELVRKVASRLEENHRKALSLFPSYHAHLFGDVTYFIYGGEEYHDQSLVHGLWYIRRGNSVSPRWDDSIVVRSASHYMTLSDIRALSAAVHELAHGYYHYKGRYTYKASREAYEQAKAGKLYLNVRRPDGYVIKKAYALKNWAEYFAELTVMYFYRESNYPFNQDSLKTYDPAGYELITNAWFRQ